MPHHGRANQRVQERARHGDRREHADEDSEGEREREAELREQAGRDDDVERTWQALQHFLQAAVSRCFELRRAWRLLLPLARALAGQERQVDGRMWHQALALEDTLDVDIFSPPRQDWLDKTDAYLRK